MKFRYIFILVAMVVALGACDPNDTIEEYTVETTELGSMLAGEWYVTYTVDGDVWASNSKISTFNTVADSGTEMWIDDAENFWGLKAVLNCDPTTNTFSGEQVDELYYGIKVDITNGKILPGAGTTAAGNVTDSISFEVTYFDIDSDTGLLDPTHAVVGGVRRTGFLEDEHE